jgi:CubicO group peptidase (beta-lactamase class C family)
MLPLTFASQSTIAPKGEYPMARAVQFKMAACFAVLFTMADASARGAGPPASESPTIPPVVDQMQRFIDAKEIAGSATLVASRDTILHLDAAGLADVESGRPMATDTIFWIASMTKPITATAVMMLQDEGKVSVDDAVEKHLPEFGGLKLPDGAPATLTIRHLLTHTSGLAEITRDQALAATTLAEVTRLYAAQPVRFEPGTEWAYCQSGINTAARIVEVASGMPFEQFLDRRLFGPLGMKDTTFYLTEEQAERLATSYRRSEDGQLESATISLLHGKGPTSRDRFPAANGGLFSTAQDYARFCQMILGGGEYGGQRFLSLDAIGQMTALQTGALQTGFTPGNGWGLGWCVVRQPQEVTAVLSPGSFGHGGAYGTQAWIDPQKERIYILMVQRANFPNSDASEVRKAFQAAAAPD